MSVEGTELFTKQQLGDMIDKVEEHNEARRLRPSSYKKKYGRTQYIIVRELLLAGHNRDDIQQRLNMPRPSLRRCIWTFKQELKNMRLNETS